MENTENGPDIERFGEEFTKDVEKAEVLREKLQKDSENKINQGIVSAEEAKEIAGKDDIFMMFGKNKEPLYPDGHSDIAVVQRDWEDGSKGRSAWYVVYKKGGDIRGPYVAHLYSTGDVHDNYYTRSVKVVRDVLEVEIDHAGKVQTLEMKLSDLHL